jgi:hypothetical protein
MKVEYKVSIRWKTEAEGGRQTAINGPTYWPNVLIPDPESKCNSWDVNLQFSQNGSGWDTSAAAMSFFSPHAPTHAIRVGMEIDLMEGPRVVAVATIESVVSSPNSEPKSPFVGISVNAGQPAATIKK